MTAWLVAIVTAILTAIIITRRISPQFRRRSEMPKHIFLANLDIPPHADANGVDVGSRKTTPSSNNREYK